jgi:hypothetical protein
MDDRRDRVEEGQVLLAADPADVRGEAGRRSISSRRICTRGSAASASLTPWANPSRSTASAPPAGSLWRSAIAMTSAPS